MRKLLFIPAVAAMLITTGCNNQKQSDGNGTDNTETASSVDEKEVEQVTVDAVNDADDAVKAETDAAIEQASENDSAGTASLGNDKNIDATIDRCAAMISQGKSIYEKVKNGDKSGIAKFAKLSTRINAELEKLKVSANDMSDSQRQRVLKIAKDYADLALQFGDAAQAK